MSFDITNFIGTGKENAVTRWELMNNLQLPDRTIRRLIQEARERGEIIINAQDGSGYYMSNDIGELKRQYASNRSRAMSVLRQQKYLRRKIREAEQKDQVTIEEVAADG